jgi:hypothetical protein
MPDFLEYLGDEHGGLVIKHGIIGHQRDLETSTMSVYRSEQKQKQTKSFKGEIKRWTQE